ncbi:ShlB/FhaC/HecB family hemolysin secretion/activation protein [Xanthomonas maliensis]|uniref:ShlB/FhaC/HecB family hemolysin secretion/activation protein n=1 Tax=Xanthomonas maliensis TaxID=1321368 RepID=UPI0003A61E74|nr:ShlB/FhaC/HecB family hemolysin secretion/activation protein [Xanthomonas maliensis]KAB7766502.1 ShlB/FhaC/HecB family hemolysin secretion/activation protein [Xanthomonas maliensis]
MWKRSVPLVLAVCLRAIARPAAAQQSEPTTLDRQEQLRQAEEIQRRQEQERQAPFVGAREQGVDARSTVLPVEALCFPIDRVRLSGGGADGARFSWLWRALRSYEGRCVGREGIDLIRRRALDQLVAHGFVTTRIGVPEQDLSRGTLRFELMPGRLRAVRVVSDGGADNWKNALPLRSGDLVDLRAIEQAVEQFKRLPSQDAKIDIAPAEQPGESDLIITLQHGRRWRGVANADDSGVQATGKWQGGLDLSLDNPLGINDLLSVGYSHDLASHDDERGTRGNSVSYNLPWGWWSVALSASSYRYHQRVDGFLQQFQSSGRSSNAQLDIQRVLHRTGTSKTSAGVVVGRRRARSYLDGVEIGIQRRDTSSAEFYLSHRQYLGALQLDMRLAHRRGTPWFDSQWTGYDPQIGFPSFRYGVTTLDLSAALPFKLGTRPLTWESSLHAQTAGELLLGSEFITIGGRYSVRGFDGEATLGAEKGAYWRNTLSAPLQTLGITPYLGLDAGRIDGISATGLRGGWFGASLDAFAGWAVHRPDGFGSAQPAYGVRVIYQF